MVYSKFISVNMSDSEIQHAILHKELIPVKDVYSELVPFLHRMSIMKEIVVYYHSIFELTITKYPDNKQEANVCMVCNEVTPVWHIILQKACSILNIDVPICDQPHIQGHYEESAKAECLIDIPPKFRDKLDYFNRHHDYFSNETHYKLVEELLLQIEQLKTGKRSRNKLSKYDTALIIHRVNFLTIPLVYSKIYGNKSIMPFVEWINDGLGENFEEEFSYKLSCGNIFAYLTNSDSVIYDKTFMEHVDKRLLRTEIFQLITKTKKFILPDWLNKHNVCDIIYDYSYYSSTHEPLLHALFLSVNNERLMGFMLSEFAPPELFEKKLIYGLIGEDKGEEFELYSSMSHEFKKLVAFHLTFSDMKYVFENLEVIPHELFLEVMAEYNYPILNDYVSKLI